MQKSNGYLILFYFSLGWTQHSNTETPVVLNNFKLQLSTKVMDFYHCLSPTNCNGLT